MRCYAVTFTTRVCVSEPADQLYRKDARYRGYLTWYIFRRHVYLPYLTLPTYKHREPQNIEIGARRNFPAKCLLPYAISLSEASLSLFMDEKARTYKKWYLPTYLPT